MIRRLAILIAVVAFGSMPTLAQTQTRPHPPHPAGQPHHPGGHAPLDPAAHAALHALVHGTWSGTWRPTEAAPAKLQLAIAGEKDGKLTVRMTSEGQVRTGVASDVTIDAHGLHWTQTLAGTSCQATAAIERPADHTAETMNGTMTCDSREIAFVLRKTKA